MNDKVREKIIGAIYTPEQRAEFGGWNSLQISLAGVLRAIAVREVELDSGEYWRVDSDGRFWYYDPEFLGVDGYNGEEVATWNLALPYDDQTDEVKAFLGKVLGV